MKNVPENPYMECPMRQLLPKIGDKWTMLVLFLIKKAEGGRIRFSEIQSQMTDCSKKMLTQTLNKAVENNLVTKEVIGSKAPFTVYYSLTPLGESLMPAIDALVLWAKDNLGGMDGESSEDEN